MTQGRVLIIAGSDSGGGAGIQADLKAVTALGGYAATAITALTAQNTEGVFGVLPVPTDFIRQQMELVLRDIGADALKTGMLHDALTIETVADVLEAEAPGVPLVADPVMVAKGGHALLQPEAVATLKRRLLPLAALITPNLPEAEVLLGRPVPDAAAMPGAAEELLGLGLKAVLLKGGHLPGEEVVDILATPAGVMRFEDRRIETRHTHGTGCTLASAIAAGLAQGMPMGAAVARARRYVRAAILAAPGFGKGHGPLGHGVTVDPGRV
ncbi:bifunctional hydroxymethylpyrimidine kinase/phosphomethylpyrimidine kinase [Siccirubricoccus sp. KC 17139]|uniref:hydroxymethylpyrimidine kinase n=1 Tax=Siccirubricoccus soli TaxID=2899147 RepID=A0ABT1DE70_9PROT|nr:bifunctional hydroxymethylpyrimidine kinase/phosphomethylpyrimidine kinase [Siccirubricoccus soli]MCO6419545.1 bifunctional hydroxymethylpyrimidine kinase/phosphomethylpyrimidine kinase [Siccirubricoccus soli]MCP2685680.1 bifunctional hydroxymethylpyrimidine kinase/phosphomethylpyrimidine kinase [Siccirubricoccus soli]